MEGEGEGEREGEVTSMYERKSLHIMTTTPLPNLAYQWR